MRLAAIILAAAMLLSAALSGCTREEADLLASIMSEPEKYSYEYNCGAKIDLAFDIFEQEGEESAYKSYTDTVAFFKLLEELVSGAGLDISMKYSGSKDGASGKTEMIMAPVIMGTKMDGLAMGVWADVDMGEDFRFKEYIKFPKVLTKGALWDYFKDREYLTIDENDWDTISEFSGIDLRKFVQPSGYKAQLASAEAYSKALTGIMIKAAGLIKTGSAYVKSAEKDAAGNTVYSVKITDQGFKELISGFAGIDKKDMKEIVRALLTATIEYVKEFDSEGELFGELIPGGVESLDALMDQYDSAFDLIYPTLKETLDEFIAALKKVKVLGDDGITLDVRVSKDGFITDFNGIIDAVIDLRGYELASGNRFYGEVSKIRVKLTFNSAYTNINKAVEVAMPKVEKKNSVSFSRYMEAIQERLGPLDPLYNMDPEQGVYDDSAWDEDFDYEDGEFQLTPDMTVDESDLILAAFIPGFRF